MSLRNHGIVRQPMPPDSRGGAGHPPPKPQMGRQIEYWLLEAEKKGLANELLGAIALPAKADNPTEEQ